MYTFRLFVAPQRWQMHHIQFLFQTFNTAFYSATYNIWTIACSVTEVPLPPQYPRVLHSPFPPPRWEVGMEEGRAAISLTACWEQVSELLLCSSTVVATTDQMAETTWSAVTTIYLKQHDQLLLQIMHFAVLKTNMSIWLKWGKKIPLMSMQAKAYFGNMSCEILSRSFYPYLWMTELNLTF